MVLRKKPSVLLPLGAALLFIGGGALAFWAVGRRGLLTKALPAGTNAIPEQALMVVALSTDEGQWRRLRQFGTPDTQAQFDETLVQWRDRLFTEAGLNFEQDVRPWVGPEITLALLPSTNPAGDANPLPLNTPEAALSSNLVIAVPIANAGSAQEGLGNRLSEASNVGDNPYRGIALQQMDTADGSTLYAAVLNPELALVSPQVGLLQQAIDAYRDSTSVADLPGVARAFEQLGDTRSLARLYVDVPAAVQAFANTADPPIPAGRLEALQNPRGLAGSIVIQNQGLYLQAMSWMDQGSQVFRTGNKADQMPQRLPANTLMMLSAGDFQQFWDDFQQGQQLSALFPIRPEEISLGFQATTGLSLEDDLLPWMGGEMSLGIVAPPAPDSDPSLPNPGLVLMVKASDRDAATATFNRLDEVMANRHRFEVETLDQGGITMTRWTAPFDSLTMTYGWLDGDVLFFTAGQGVEGLVAPRPNRPLATQPLFQSTTGDAPRPNNGHFFLNLRDLASVENSLLLPPLPAEGLLSAEAIEAIGVTATVLSDRQVRYDITAHLKRGNRPGALPRPTVEPPAATPPETPSEAAPN